MPKRLKKEKQEKQVRGKAFFGEAPIWKVVLIMAVPSMVMMFSIGSYFFFDNVLSINLASDSYIDADNNILSAYYIPGLPSPSLVRIFMNGYAPINALMMAIALLMGVGISTRVAINLGRGDLERAKNTLRTGFMFGILLAILSVPILLLSAKPWIAQQYGAFDSRSVRIIQEEAFRYAWPIIATYPIYLFGNMCSSLFRVEARNKQMLIVMIAPIFINLFLDWVMMGPVGMGVEGGAWATVIANTSTALLAVFFIFRSPNKSLLKFNILFGFKIKVIAIVGILLVGLAPFLRNMAQSITTSVQNNLTNQVSSAVFYDNYLTAWKNLSYESQINNIQQTLTLMEGTEKFDVLRNIFDISATGKEAIGPMAVKIQENIDIIFNADQSFIDNLNATSFPDLSAQQATYLIFMADDGIIRQQSASAMISIMSGAMPVFILFFPIMYSFAQSARPIAAYNYGLRNYHRVRQVYFWTIAYASIIAIVIYFLVAWGISGPLIDLLQIKNTDLLDQKTQGQNALKIVMLTMVFFSPAVAGMVAFGSTDRIILSIIASSLNGLIIFWPVIFGFKEAALANPQNDLMFIWFLPVASAITSVVISLLVIHNLTHLDKKEQVTLDDRIQKVYEWRDQRNMRKKQIRLTKKAEQARK